ncbi:hypothetical protein PYCC9005_002594 [Savitreella phatthalungensis]
MTIGRRRIRNKGARPSGGVGPETEGDATDALEPPDHVEIPSDGGGRIIDISRLEALLQSKSEYLRLRERTVNELPLALFQSVAFANLRILNVRGCNLSHLPPQVIQLRHLQHLDVSDNLRIRLPSQLRKLNLQRFICSETTRMEPETWDLPYTTDLSKAYCGDRADGRRSVPSLGQLCATKVVESCSLSELDLFRDFVPTHLRRWLYPYICHECGRLGRLPVASRTRRCVIALKLVPLHFSVCSLDCLDTLQQTFVFEDELNKEKRLARQAKFGGASTILSSVPTNGR